MFVFLDADTIVNARVITAAIRAINQGAVGGGCEVRFDGRLPLYARAFVAVTVPLYRVLRLASGCFLFCTREAFHASGGFDEGLFAAEEGAMSRALGRHGRFVVLREFVVTSGRKFRAHSAPEVLGLLAHSRSAGANQCGGGKVWSFGTGNGGATPSQSLDRPLRGETRS